MNYFVFIRRNYHCFTGNVKFDVASANKIINNTINNNSAHGYVSAFKWAYNNFYGMKFNTKYIVSRPNEISKFTTRLTNKEISYVRKKYKEWINEKLTCVKNLQELIRHKRLGYYYVFETLLCSGMRIGELASINFRANPAHRIIESKISGCDKAEIIINTEKTCKKREIYIPLDAYKFFVRYKWKIKGNLVRDNFIMFRNWAKLPFKLTAHVLRRTKASIMHEYGVDVNTISMVLGNTPRTVMNHYIISSNRNYDACDIADCAVNGYIVKTNNLYFNRTYLSRKE